jgi:hypothetical protein
MMERASLRPTCDGKLCTGRPNSDVTKTLLGEAKNALVNAYSVVNERYAALRAHRDVPRDSDDPAVERHLLRRIEKALLNKEKLENRYAAYGITVTPVFREGFTIDLRFQHPGSEKYLVAGSSASRFVALSLPDGFEEGRRMRGKFEP